MKEIILCGNADSCNLRMESTSGFETSNDQGRLSGKKQEQKSGGWVLLVG